MKKQLVIMVTYRMRDTKCPMGHRIFAGKDADVLAANFQSAHPELEEVSCTIRR